MELFSIRIQRTFQLVSTGKVAVQRHIHLPVYVKMYIFLGLCFTCETKEN